MTPLTNQKLVEAFQEFKKSQKAERDYHRQNCEGHDINRQSKEITDESYRLYKVAMEQRDRVLAIVEEIASAPMKEFPANSGMGKQQWLDLAEHMDDMGCGEFEAAACRQIAEGLSE